MDDLPDILSIASDLVAIFGLLFVIYQVRQLERSVRSGAVSSIYAEAAEVRKTLIENPELLPYFFDNIDITPEHTDYPKARVAAEMHLNYLEHLVVEKDNFGQDNWKSWSAFIARAIECSPLIRRLLRENADSYAKELCEIADCA